MLMLCLRLCDSLLNLLLGQDLDRIVEDITHARPGGGSRDEIPTDTQVSKGTTKRNKEMRKEQVKRQRNERKKNNKNIQQPGFACGHPPYY